MLRPPIDLACCCATVRTPLRLPTGDGAAPPACAPWRGELRHAELIPSDRVNHRFRLWTGLLPYIGSGSIGATPCQITGSLRLTQQGAMTHDSRRTADR